MPFAQTSFLRSFRFQIIAAMSGVVLVTLLLTTFLVHAFVGPSIRLDFDNQILHELDGAIFDVRDVFGDHVPVDIVASPKFPELKSAMERRAKSRGNLRWMVRLIDGKGEIVFSSESLPEVPIPSLRDLDRPHAAGTYRWIAAKCVSSGPGQAIVQIGRSEQALEEDLALLDRTLIVRGLLVIILTPLGGYLLARHVAKPIAAIISTANRLQPEHLSERLPLRGVNDELDRVSQTINRMLDRVAGYIDKNRSFVANAAHELRSPLAAIRSSAEVALNRPRSAEEYANVLTEMIDEVGRLSSMVNRLLLLAESDAGRIAMTTTHSARLDLVVREAIEMFQAVAETRHIELRLAAMDSIAVPGEENLWRHVVRNLIDNAIKFSPEGTTVSIKAERIGADVRLAVTDHGIGIAKEDLPHVFERFFRSDRARVRDEGRSGTGLGLSICKAIVESLGGSIRVESELGRGATFVVTIPSRAI